MKLMTPRQTRTVLRYARGSLVALSLAGMIFQMWMLPELLAQELNEAQKAQHIEDAAREQRISIDDTLITSERYAALCHRVVESANRLMAAHTQALPTVEATVDLELLSKRISKLKLQTLAELTTTKARLIEGEMNEDVMGRHDLFTAEAVEKYRIIIKHIDLVVQGAENELDIDMRATDLIDLISHDLGSAFNKADQSSLQRHRASIKPQQVGAAPYFQWPWQLADASDVIAQTLLSGLTATAVAEGTPPEELDRDILTVLSDLDDGATEVDPDHPVVLKAAELEHDPVKIYEFVRNSIVYEPYFGAMKGARQTLLEGAGNDIDTATLLAALLRASNVPCRYVFGTVEMSVEDAAAWIGVFDANQVTKIFSANGIPFKTMGTADGQVSQIQMDHVWVKAYVDFFPYRGVDPVDESASPSEAGDAWIDLDASFKQHRFLDSRELASLVGIDPLTLIANVKRLSKPDTVDDNFVEEVPDGLITDELFSLSGPLRDYLAANGLVSETAFRQRIVSEERFGILPVSDQYSIVARGLNFRSLPDGLQHQIKIELKTRGQASSTLLLNDTPLESLAGRVITLSYAPDAGSASVVDLFADDATIPSYLLTVIPELLIDGVRSAVQPSQALMPTTGMGNSQDIIITFTSPDGSSETVTQYVQAGGYHALILNHQQVVGGALDIHQARLDQAIQDLGNSAIPDSTKRELSIGNVLHGIGLSYFHQLDRFNQIASGSLGVVITRRPSVVKVSWDLGVNPLNGQATADRVRIDVGRDVYVPVATAAVDPDAENDFLFLTAITSSALEHNALIQALPPTSNGAVSVVRIIEVANETTFNPAGKIPVYTVRPTGQGGNYAAFLADATDVSIPAEDQLPAWALTDILNAVNNRQEVTVPLSKVLVNGEKYVGYIKRDVDNGASQFVLRGDLATANNGGESVMDAAAIDIPTPSDLLRYGSSDSRYLGPVTTSVAWLKAAEDATTNVGLTYLPAIVNISDWFQNRTTDLDPVTTVASAIAVSGPMTRISSQPAVLDIAVTPELANETVTITGRVTRGAVWTAEILNSAGEPVFEQQGSWPA